MAFQRGGAMRNRNLRLLLLPVLVVGARRRGSCGRARRPRARHRQGRVRAGRGDVHRDHARRAPNGDGEWADPCAGRCRQRQDRRRLDCGTDCGRDDVDQQRSGRRPHHRGPGPGKARSATGCGSELHQLDPRGVQARLLHVRIERVGRTPASGVTPPQGGHEERRPLVPAFGVSFD